MDIEQRQPSETQENDKSNPNVVRKENIYTSYKPFIAFVVKQFTFDAIPISEYHTIYSDDPVSTLKNQIKYYQGLFLKCAKQIEGIENEQNVFVYLVESDHKRLRDHCYEITSKVLDLENADFKMAMEKELKVRKPTHFDPDFSGSISFTPNGLHLEYKTYKDKVYPKVIISSFRKIVRMILIVERVFHLFRRTQPIECHFIFHYCKNQLGSEMPDQLITILKSDVTLKVEFVKMNAFKTELAHM